MHRPTTITRPKARKLTSGTDLPAAAPFALRLPQRRPRRQGPRRSRPQPGL